MFLYEIHENRNSEKYILFKSVTYIFACFLHFSYDSDIIGCRIYLQAFVVHCEFLNTFTAIIDLSRFNNSCLKSPTSTLVDLTF